MPGRDGQRSGRGQPAADSITPSQPTVSYQVVLAAPPSASDFRLPSVHPAPISDICRTSTRGGSPPDGAGGAGPVAYGLTRFRSVIGETARGRFPENPR